MKTRMTKTGMTFLMAGLMGLFLITGEASAQSLRDVATSAARVDRTDADAVREVQIGLRDLGFYQGPIDGVFGQLTYAAAVAAVEAVNAEVASTQAARTQSLSASLTSVDDGPSETDRGEGAGGFDLASNPPADTPSQAAPTPVSGSGSVESSSVGGAGSPAAEGSAGAAGVAGIND